MVRLQGTPLLALALLLACPHGWGEPFEAAWSDAAAPFDGLNPEAKLVMSPGRIVPSAAPGSEATVKTLALNAAASPKADIVPKSKQPDIVGPGRAPQPREDRPRGIGPVSWESRPGYLKGLLGGLLGLLAAPFAFALEAVQAVALIPVRMVKGAVEGDFLSLLDPLRTAKNLLQDTAVFAAGVINLASAPVWNALRPDQATDFQYAHNRLIFTGGPVAGILAGGDVRYAAAAPSWHTVFATRGIGAGVYQHEFVHNRQWRNSFFWEKVREHGPEWRDQEAREYLNW